MTLPESSEPRVDVTEVDPNKISQEIKNLADDVDGNPETQEQLNNALTDAVVDGLTKLDQSARDTLKQSVLHFLENHGNKPGFEDSNVGFIKLAEGLGLQKNSDGTWGEKEVTEGVGAPEGVDNVTKIELPDSPLSGTLEGIDNGEDGKRITTTYSQLVRNRPELQDGEDKTPEGKRLYETTDKIESQLTIITNLLQDDKLKDNESIKGLSDMLNNIKNTLNNTSVDNVRKLQEFIYKNLEGDSYQEEYKLKNHWREGRGFDGQFGESSLKGLNLVLAKTQNYLDDVSKKLKEFVEQEDEQKLDAVAANPEVNYIQGSGDPDLKDWLTNLPDGANVSFFDDAEKEKLNTPGDPEIKLKVEFNGKEKEIVVKVNVTNSSTEDTPDRRQPDVQPLPLGDKQYLPMETKPSSYPEGAIFYSTKPYSPEVSASESGSDLQTPDLQGRFTAETNEIDGDRTYFMRVGDNTYEVKIDELGNLCPVAKNVDSKKPVVFEGNDSCKMYLRGKMPQELRNKSISITWNGKDYVMGLGGYNKKITIEPMTIAGFWLKGNAGERGATLTESLAFLNLTNYLRNVGKYKDVEFINDNPNLKMIGNELYVRVNRKKNVGFGDDGEFVKKGKWLLIKKEEFGLTNDTNLMSRFIRYNNHEDWNDNWDNKTPNKYYTTVQI